MPWPGRSACVPSIIRATRASRSLRRASGRRRIQPAPSRADRASGAQRKGGQTKNGIVMPEFRKRRALRKLEAKFYSNLPARDVLQAATQLEQAKIERATRDGQLGLQR